MNLLDNMKKHRQYNIADTPGHIFEYASEHNFNLEKFVTEYMNSKFCQNMMDVSYSPFQNESPRACMEVILNEFSNNGISISIDENKKYRYCAYYIGFVYRYLQIFSGLSSKELYKKIPFEKIVLNYYFDHYEYPDAIREICKYEGFSYDD
jgi:hypothetical protein